MSGIYNKGREAFLRGQIAWLTDDIKAILVAGAYTPNFTTDQYLSDISAPAQVAVSNSLSSKTVTNGWAGCENIVWDTASNGVCVGMVIVQDTGVAATSHLLAYLNSGITNFPLDTNGAKVTFFPDPGTGLFRI